MLSNYVQHIFPEGEKIFKGVSPPCAPLVTDLFRTGVIKLSLAIYPFSISIDEHVLLGLPDGRYFAGLAGILLLI